MLRLSDLSPAVRARLGLETATKPNKYGAVRKMVGEERFDSSKEARRYQELLALERIGEIENLQTHPAFNLTRDGIVIAVYHADFRYSQRGVWCVEDVKSKATRTEAYQLRKRLVESQHGINLREV